MGKATQTNFVSNGFRKHCSVCVPWSGLLILVTLEDEEEHDNVTFQW